MRKIYLNINDGKFYWIYKPKKADDQWTLYHSGYIGITYLAIIYLIVAKYLKQLLIWIKWY